MRPRRSGIKVAQMGGGYAQMREAWLEADISLPEDEGWTVLTALLVESTRIRGGEEHRAEFLPEAMEGDIIGRARAFSAAGARAIWTDVVQRLRQEPRYRGLGGRPEPPMPNESARSRPCHNA